MRNLIAAFLLPAVLAQGCASTATSPTSHPNSSLAKTADLRRTTDPDRLKDVSDELAGEAATVELTSGEVVQKAQSLRIGTETTTWYDASGRERTVPTAEVRRVLREQRHLIGRGFGYGAAIAVLPAILVANSTGCHRNCGDEPLAGLGQFVAGLLTVVAGGLIGMVVAAGMRHPVVVYDSLPPPAAAAAAAAGSTASPAADSTTNLHCRLSKSAAAGGLDCGPVTR
jgi:hypothetical protein